MKDIVVTWPKSRPLGSYLAELELAKRDGLHVSFRVPSRPSPIPERCYRVHDGMVVGWLRVITVAWSNTVSRVGSDPRGRAEVYWPAGIYVTCDPEWHSIDHRSARLVMPGFRGWRWFDRTTVE